MNEHQRLAGWVNRLFRWAGAVLAAYWIVLFVSTHVPPDTTGGELPWPHADKALHVVAYAGLAFLAAAAWTTRRTLMAAQYASIALALAAYAALDELSQLLPVVGRHADLLDWVADTVGTLVGLAIFATAADFARRRLGLRLERIERAKLVGNRIAARPESTAEFEHHGGHRGRPTP